MGAMSTTCTLTVTAQARRRELLSCSTKRVIGFRGAVGTEYCVC
jgi:hypothetical protein